MEGQRQPNLPTPFAVASKRHSHPGDTQPGSCSADNSWAAVKLGERSASVASSDSTRVSLDSFASGIVCVGADARSRAPLRTTSGLSAYRSRRLTLTARDAALFTASQGLTPLLNAPAHQPAQASWVWPFHAGQQPLALVPPPIAPGLLPEVNDNDFLPYLRDCADTFASFEQAVQTLRSEPKGSGKNHPEPGEGLLAALREVPQLYFAEDFSLTRREVWEQVGLGAQDEQQLAEHHEQAVLHFDACETHFAEEVAARSSHLFEAAGVVGDLRACLGGCYDLVHGMRCEIQEMNENVLEAAVRVQGLQRRRKNVHEVAEHLRGLAVVAAALEAASLLVPQGAYVAALDVLDELGAAVDSSALAGLHAFRSLPQQLASFRREVDETMLSGFLQAAYFTQLDAVVANEVAVLQNGDSRQPQAASPDAGNELPADAAAGNLSQLAAEEFDLDTERLTPLVLGLRRTGRLHDAMVACREMVAVEVKQAIRDVVEQGLPHLLDASWDIPAEAYLADRLQMLTAGAFLALLEAVRSVTAACMARAAGLQTAVMGVLRTGGAQRAQLTEAEGLLGLLGQSIADAAQARCTKLLAARAEQAAQGSLAELYRLLTAAGSLADLGARAGAKPSAPLRQALQLQCRAYLDHLHRTHLTRLSGLLDNEIWVAAEVPAAAQATVDSLESAAAQAVEPPGAAGAASLAEQNGVHAEESDHRPGVLDRLRVGAGRFAVVEGELALLGMLQAYHHLQALAPDLAPEIGHRAVELLKVFNSRTCQLVLGAGAMQTTGLKSISAKHLALSCQCLAALIALHPTIVPVFTAGLSPSRRAVLVPEYARALQDLRVHHNEILGKFVGIMRERLTASLRQLPTLAAQWHSARAHVQPQPSAFASTLAKQLRILLQVLSTTLQQQELEVVFGNVARLYSRAVAEAFGQLPSQGPAWQAQCTADLHALLESLQALPLPDGQRAAYLDPLVSLCTSRFPLAASGSTKASGKLPMHPPDGQLQGVRRFVSEEPAAAADAPAPEPPDGLRQTVSAGELTFAAAADAASASGEGERPHSSLPPGQRQSESEELFLAKRGSQGEAAGFRGAPLDAPPVLEAVPEQEQASLAADAMRSIVPPSRGDSLTGPAAHAEASDAQHEQALAQTQEPPAFRLREQGSGLSFASDHTTESNHQQLPDRGGQGACQEVPADGPTVLAEVGAGTPPQAHAGDAVVHSTGLSPEVSLGFIPGEPAELTSPMGNGAFSPTLMADGVIGNGVVMEEGAVKGLDAATILQRIEELARARSASQSTSQ